MARKKSKPLNGLFIRAGAVRKPDLGFLLAFDPKEEDEEIPHTIFFRWKAGAFNSGRAGFSAHSCCVVDDPESAFVTVGSDSTYSVENRDGVVTGNIFEDAPQRPGDETRFGGIRTVAEIGRKGYAAGFSGTVYRLDAPTVWTPAEDGLPHDLRIEAIHGSGASDMYAVGFGGEIWRFDGQIWRREEAPTNVILAAVKCAGKGDVYAAGAKGVLLRRRDDTWEVIEHEATEDDIWGLEVFMDDLYISTMSGVYVLRGGELIGVNFGADPPRSTYKLSAAPGVPWSIGRSDVMSFDGERWTRVV